jgi:hypothetical protein
VVVVVVVMVVVLVVVILVVVAVNCYMNMLLSILVHVRHGVHDQLLLSLSTASAVSVPLHSTL